MRVIEIGNLTGIEGLDCGILIEASEEELKGIAGNLLYKKVEIYEAEGEPNDLRGALVAVRQSVETIIDGNFDPNTYEVLSRMLSIVKHALSVNKDTRKNSIREWGKF